MKYHVAVRAGDSFSAIYFRSEAEADEWLNKNLKPNYYVQKIDEDGEYETYYVKGEFNWRY